MAGKDLYYDKYLKYKNKYLNLKDQMGGVITDIEKEYYEQSNDVTFPNIQEGEENDIYHIIEYLKRNTNLKKLTFINIAQILDNPAFENLFLINLRSYGIYQNITHLNFRGNKQQNIQLEDRHVEKLARLLTFYRDLEHIDLTNNNITKIGFEQLIIGLKDLNFNRTEDSNFIKNIEVHFEGNPIVSTPRNSSVADIVRLQNEPVIFAREHAGITAYVS
jgi:hypothetical protein